MTKALGEIDFFPDTERCTKTASDQALTEVPALQEDVGKFVTQIQPKWYHQLLLYLCRTAFNELNSPN